ncbi:MAG TPA: hypothetical protein VND64_12270 [Pirellulales bacterium]|nr:hypothetical protein [Pirellulales bacterium]
MNSQERRGKWIFLTLAAYLALERIVETGLSLSHGLAIAPAIQSVALAFLLIVVLLFLWRGENTLRWLVGVWCLLSGGMSLVICIRPLIGMAAITPAESIGTFFQVTGIPFAVAIVKGLLKASVGLAILLLPGVQAFFRYQRLGRRPKVRVGA